jgi:Trk-type K+ transport system membrane component
MKIDITEIAQAMLAFVFSVAVISMYIFVIAATLLLMAHRMPWAI